MEPILVDDAVWLLSMTALHCTLTHDVCMHKISSERAKILHQSEMAVHDGGHTVLYAVAQHVRRCTADTAGISQ